MAYKDIISAYDEYIAKESERLKKARPELYEEVAQEMAGRGLLGGGTQIRQLGKVVSTHEEYLNQLYGKRADLKAQLLAKELERQEAERQAKKLRQAQMLQTLTAILTTPGSKTKEEKMPIERIGKWLGNIFKKRLPIPKIGNQVQSIARPSGGQGSTGGLPKSSINYSYEAWRPF